MFQEGAIVENLARYGTHTVWVNPSEMVASKKQMACLYYSFKPDRKCYHARKSMKLKHYINKYIRK